MREAVLLDANTHLHGLPANEVNSRVQYDVVFDVWRVSDLKSSIAAVITSAADQKLRT